MAAIPPPSANRITSLPELPLKQKIEIALPSLSALQIHSPESFQLNLSSVQSLNEEALQKWVQSVKKSLANFHLSNKPLPEGASWDELQPAFGSQEEIARLKDPIKTEVQDPSQHKGIADSCSIL